MHENMSDFATNYAHIIRMKCGWHYNPHMRFYVYDNFGKRFTVCGLFVSCDYDFNRVPYYMIMILIPCKGDGYFYRPIQLDGVSAYRSAEQAFAVLDSLESRYGGWNFGDDIPELSREYAI